MARHTADAEATSIAPIEIVWHLLSTVETWPTWSLHQVARLERPGSPIADGLGAIRQLGRTPKKVNREEVVAFDPPNHFAYQILSGLDVDHYRADVRLAPTSDGGTHIIWESRFDASGIRRWYLRLLIAWVVKRWSADLAKGAERAPDESHPGQVASQRDQTTGRTAEASVPPGE